VTSLGLDGKYLYSGSYDFTAIRWNISSGNIDKKYVGHADSVLSIEVGSTLLFSGSFDTSVRVWNKEDPTFVKFFRCKLYSIINFLVSAVPAAICHYNDDVLIVGTEGLDLVEISTGQVLARQTGLS